MSLEVEALDVVDNEPSCVQVAVFPLVFAPVVEPLQMGNPLSQRHLCSHATESDSQESEHTFVLRQTQRDA